MKRKKIRLFGITAYVCFYRSMLRYFPGVSPQFAAWLTYTLNTANLASFRYENPQAFMAETPASLFFDELTESKCRSYHTEVKMYRALEALIMNTEPKALSADQNYAVLQVCAMMDVLEEIFYGEYGVEIYSGATIYDVCEMSLTPDFLEPDVCLMYDWLMV